MHCYCYYIKMVRVRDGYSRNKMFRYIKLGGQLFRSRKGNTTYCCEFAARRSQTINSSDSYVLFGALFLKNCIGEELKTSTVFILYRAQLPCTPPTSVCTQDLISTTENIQGVS